MKSGSGSGCISKSMYNSLEEVRLGVIAQYRADYLSLSLNITCMNNLQPQELKAAW